MKCLVAGGMGMIGRNVVRSLAAQGHEVMVCDSKNVAHSDLRDRDICEMYTIGMDRVFHLADRTVGIGYSSTHHGQMMTDSLLISLNLLEAARKAGVKDYLYVSSSCVYSDICDQPAIEENGFFAGPEIANEGYGWAKRIAERQCAYYAREYGMRTVIARPANIYGPSYDWTRPLEDMHVIPALICKMLRGDKEIMVWGSGKTTRTFQYESSTARAIVALAEGGTPEEAYNLGGIEIALHLIVELIAMNTQYRGIIRYDDTRPGGPSRKAQDTNKLSALLPEFRQSVRLQEGICLTIEAARKALAIA